MNDVELFWEELMQENLPIWQQCLAADGKGYFVGGLPERLYGG